MTKEQEKRLMEVRQATKEILRAEYRDGCADAINPDRAGAEERIVERIDQLLNLRDAEENRIIAILMPKSEQKMPPNPHYYQHSPDDKVGLARFSEREKVYEEIQREGWCKVILPEGG